MLSTIGELYLAGYQSTDLLVLVVVVVSMNCTIIDNEMQDSFLV